MRCINNKDVEHLLEMGKIYDITVDRTIRQCPILINGCGYKEDRFEVVNDYKINVKSFLFTETLGEEFELPYSEELDKAVLLINKLCSEKAYSIKTSDKIDLILDKLHKALTIKEQREILKAYLE